MGPKNSVWGVYAHGNAYINQGGPPEPPPLTSPFRATYDRGPSCSLLDDLRSTARRVPLIGREREIETALRWREEPVEGGQDDRVMVIHGPGGAGKTRLAAEILQRAADEGWTAGFLSGNLRTYPRWPTLVRPSTPTMIAVDYAEARYDDLRVLFDDLPLGHAGDAPLRLILIIREGPSSKSWFERLAHERSLPDRGRALLDEGALTVLSLEHSLEDLGHRTALWTAAYAIYASDDSSSPDYLEDEIFERPLFILLDAFRVSQDDDGEDESDATPTRSALMQAALGHEREYWRRSLDECNVSLDERGMNQVAVIATLVSGVDRQGFESALAALDWLESDRQMRLRVADWWCLVYATDASTIRGVEPDPIGEYLVAQSMDDSGDPRSLLAGSMATENLTSLIEAATLVGRQRILRVLTRIAASSSDPGHALARSTLSELLRSHLDEFLPAALDPVPPVADAAGEPLSLTVASAILASDQLELVAEGSDEGRARPEDRGPDESSIRPAALKVIRRQLDIVGRREFENERWSAGRFASLIGWALHLDLEAQAIESAEQRIADLRDLEPRSHHALASALTTMGRYHLSLQKCGPAERAFLEAVEEFRAAGEEHEQNVYVLFHDLAETANAAGDHDLAIERFRTAFEGKRRLLGLPDEETQITVTALIVQLAEADLEAAVKLADESVVELEDAGADENVLRHARRNRPRAMLSAGRLAERQEKLGEAKPQYQGALDELVRLEDADSELAHILGHDLADIALTEGETQAALALYSAALAGKSRLAGPEAPTTITTLLAEARASARLDIDVALRRLEEYERDLGAIRPETLARLTEEKIDILSNARRFDEASVVARRFRVRLLRADLQLAIFDAAVDQTIENVPMSALGLEGCMLASLVFAPGDSRFLPLASRLGIVMFEGMLSLFSSQMSSGEIDQAFPDPEMFEKFVDGPISTPAQTIESINRISGRDNLILAILRTVKQSPVTVQEWTRGAMREALEDLARQPFLHPLVTAGDRAWNEIPHDAETRRWLAYNTFVGFAFEAQNWRELAIGIQLTLYRGLLYGVITEAQLDFALPLRAWRSEVDPPELAAIERELVKDLEDSGQVAPGDGESTVSRARLCQIVNAGCISAENQDTATATRLFERAMDGLRKLAEPDKILACMITDDLGEIAAAEGDDMLAIERFRSAFAEIRGLVGLRDHTSQTIFANLIRALARENLQVALDEVTAMVEELKAEGADGVTMRAYQLNRARALIHAGHIKKAGGDRTAASALYLRSLEELKEVGEDDGVLAYGMTHNLGDIAAEDGDRTLAGERYRTAFEGHQRLLGLVDQETIGSLFGLVRTLARDDLDAALSELSAALAALGAERADEETALKLRRERAIAMLEAGREHKNRRDYDGASSIYRRALTVISDLGESDSPIARVITHELGDAAVGQERIDVAIRYYTEAYEQGHRLVGLADPNTLRSLSTLTRTLAHNDLAGALAKLRGAALELESTGGDAEVLERLRRDRVTALTIGGRASLARGEQAEAEADFRDGLAEIAMLGGEDEILHYVFVHDLGDLARAEGKPEVAIDRYRSALAGKRRLRGLAYRGTQETLSTLVRTIAAGDLNGALALVDETEEELAREEGAESVIDSLRGVRAEAIYIAARSRHAGADPSGSVDLYEEALEAMRASFGPSSPVTMGCFGGLLDAIARTNPDEAITRANAAVEQLQPVDADGSAVASVREWLAQNAPAATGSSATTSHRSL
jgi:tetratricopeptide (TPR) repeat protein